jgi:hypothetical protein
MSVSVNQATARTDVRPHGGTGSADPLRAVRRGGAALAAGATTWALTSFAVGFDPAEDLQTSIGDIGGLAFQLGVFALLTVMWRTRATGTSRAARIMLGVEFVLLTIASLWSVLHAIDPSGLGSTTFVMALDPFWPLSMLGMFVIGVKVFRARRWQGSLRVAPLIAETWVFFGIGATVAGAVTGIDWLPTVVGGLHLILGYARLGWLLTRRPQDALVA